MRCAADEAVKIEGASEAGYLLGKFEARGGVEGGLVGARVILEADAVEVDVASCDSQGAAVFGRELGRVWG